MPDTSVPHKRISKRSNGLLSEGRTAQSSVDKTVILRDKRDGLDKKRKKSISKLIFEEVNVYQVNSKECVKTMHILMLNYRAIAKGIYSNGFLIRDEVIFLSGILSSMAAFCFASGMNEDCEAIEEAVKKVLDQPITDENIDVFHKIYIKLNVPH